MDATDEKAILILRREGPLTAGEIAQKTGLTTASVTTLIDRLEQKGLVKRARDKSDLCWLLDHPLGNSRIFGVKQMEGYLGILPSFIS